MLRAEVFLKVLDVEVKGWHRESDIPCLEDLVSNFTTILTCMVCMGSRYLAYV